MPLGTEVYVGAGDVVGWGRMSPLKGSQPPSFRFVSIVAKQLDGLKRHLVRK